MYKKNNIWTPATVTYYYDVYLALHCTIISIIVSIVWSTVSDISVRIVKVLILYYIPTTVDDNAGKVYTQVHIAKENIHRKIYLRRIYKYTVLYTIVIEKLMHIIYYSTCAYIARRRHLYTEIQYPSMSVLLLLFYHIIRSFVPKETFFKTTSVVWISGYSIRPLL